ncbi:amino acid transporter heavy chain SLC3A2-like [Symphalangus syndactylus]|uniref:amino acid transporter heavy chain SLC3A2-like n=1 Tax=Symphalangus syndactylus TaxID=9590 RepID=UPI0030040B90
MRFHCVAQADLELLGSNYPPTSASQNAGTTEMGSHYAAQAALVFLASNDPLTSASQSPGITEACCPYRHGRCHAAVSQHVTRVGRAANSCSHICHFPGGRAHASQNRKVSLNKADA